MCAIRVLLIDDHEMVAESFRRALSATDDVEVVAVGASAAEAVALADAHRPDVILMDYRLPDATGATAASQIRQHTPDAKIIMLTGSADRSALIAAVDAGCVGYLDKIVGLDRLISAVHSAAAGEVILSADELSRVAGPRRMPVSGAAELTARELDVLNLVAEGMSNKAIAGRLFLSVNTVRTHVQAVLTKLGAHSKLEAVAIATRDGRLPPR